MEEGCSSVTFVVILFALLVRFLISTNSYSGANTPPMYGDYEAQRHWMEITYNLPVDQWYQQSKDNDLLYWGLDYPPLTAYHSYVCGYIASLLNPDWIALNNSRGFESYEHKLFMRYSVLAVDTIIFIPAVVVFFLKSLRKENKMKQVSFIGAMLLYPGLVLIDHGHFQYNCVSLGLTLWAIIFLFEEKFLIGSAFFVMALNYKQMELYHALPFFFYLLGTCWNRNSWIVHARILFLALFISFGVVAAMLPILAKLSAISKFQSLKKLLQIGVAVIFTFALCWLPFLKSINSVLAVVQRLFPFNRGLYEDKVANFWCSVSILVKFQRFLQQSQIVLLCLATTFITCLPSCLDLMFHPTKKKFLYSLVSCSFSFFLFSYQVHEKSILLVALPISLLLPESPLIASWFLIVSTVSMYPLLLRDGQSASYFGLLIMMIVLTSTLIDWKQVSFFVKTMMILSISTCLLLHLTFAAFSPPQRFPDFYSLAFAIYSCAHFLMFWAYFNYTQLIRSGRNDKQFNELFCKPLSAKKNK